uniref:O-acyltransferase n=1 Tax=Acrobeloides nanus TaxID=290746 RepID=A0A914D2Y0_9BILA
MVAYLMSMNIATNENSSSSNAMNINNLNINGATILNQFNQEDAQALLDNKIKRNLFDNNLELKDKILHSTKHLVSVLLAGLLIYEISVPSYFDVLELRVLVTITTGLVIFMGCLSPNLLFTNGLFLHIGDLSYVLYLVHWPILKYIRYESTRIDFDLKDGLFVIMMSYLTSLIFNKHVENRILKSKIRLNSFSYATIFSQTFLFFIIYYNIGIPRIIQEKSSTTLITNNKAMDISYHLIRNLKYTDGYVDFLLPRYIGNKKYNRLHEKYPTLSAINKPSECLSPSISFPRPGQYICENRKNGAVNVLIIGNSITPIYYNVIEHAFNNRYSVIRMKYISTVFGFIKEVQPDILIFTLAYSDGYNVPIVKNDSCVEATNKFFADIKPYAKVIILPNEEIILIVA